MNPRDPKLLVGSRPVNRRTAPKVAPPPAPLSPLAKERTSAAHARQRLGAPLAELLRPRADASVPLPAAAVVGGVVAAGGAIALFLALLQGSVLLGGLGALGAAGGVATAWRFRRPANLLLEEAPTTPLLDDEAIRAFDGALAQIAPEVPSDSAQLLADIKQLVVRIARNPASAQSDEHFTIEDRMYVVQCVRRYLPDALQAYVTVPKAQRAAAVAEGQTPQAVLLSQLGMLKAALQEREQKLARSAAEQLLRQERFLKSKG